MIRSKHRSWIAIALVAAAGAFGAAAQVAGPIIGIGSADQADRLRAPASIDDPSAGLRASPNLLPDDGVPDVLVGPDNGSRVVRLLSGVDGSEIASGDPFGPAFTGGVRVAYGDLTGDGVPDPIVAMGNGGGLVRLFDGANLTNFLSGFPFGPTFTGGVYVAAGDVSGDGRADVVVAQGRNGGEVHVYNAAGHRLAAGAPFGPAYSGGVRVAVGDVNGDGRADVITAQASGGRVSVFDGAGPGTLVSGFPYGAGFGGGVFVAAGDVNGDGHSDVIVAPGTGNGPVMVVDGRTLSVIGTFPAYPAGFTGGVRVAAADLTGDGRADIITAPGPGGQPMLRVFDGATFTLVAQAFAYDIGFSGGVFVAAPTSSGRLRFTSASTTTFTIGVNGTFGVTTTGAPPATSVTETGALPDGVTFTDNSDGTATLAGTPAEGSAGPYSLTFTATNGVGPNETQTFTLEVVDAPPRVTATTPADGATAVPIDAPLVVTFSEPVNVTPGAFSLQCPPGTPVAFSVPTASPATQFTIDPTVDLPATTACTLRVAADQVTDADADDPPDTLAADVMVSFTTSACAAITVTPTTLTGGNVSLAYGPVTFTQVGGAAPITWSVTSGALPTGLTLAPSTGVLSGTPTATGSIAFTVTATASSGCTGDAALTLNIAAGPNQAPSFVAGPAQTVNEDSGAQSVPGWATAISPGPSDEASQTVTFNVVGNTNPGLFITPPAVSPAGVLTYAPAANANGTATIALVVQDDGGTALGGVDTSAPQNLVITVNAVNDAPSFAAGADVTVLENVGQQTFPAWATALSAGPPDEAVQTLTFSVTANSNAALFSVQPAVSSSGELTFTPASNAAGTATIALTLQDSGGTALGGVDTSAAQTFTITLTGVNTAPSFTKGADQTVHEDSGAQSVPGWATAITPGPPDESGQTVTFNVTGNTNAALFSAAPAISPTGTLTYTPAANANGSATITLVLQDDGGTADGGVDTSAPQDFFITVTAVNDAPSFVAGAGPTSAEDAGAQSIPNWATSISAGPADEAAQALTFVVTGNTNPTLFSAAPTVSPTGTLTYTSAPNAFGTADITLVVQDNGGTDGGGVDTSGPQTFTITVTPVNDAPTLASPAIAYTTVGNTQLHVAGKTLAGLTATSDADGVLTKSGPSDIDGPVAPFAVALSGVATPNGTVTLDADGSFHYVPNAGFTGIDTFTVQVTDSVTPVDVTVNVTVSNRVWYVNNHLDADNPAGGDGRSTDAFETLSAAATASDANDIIFVFAGDTATTPLTGGIALENGQKLHGEGVGLTVGALSLVPAGTRPRITAAADAVTVLANTANGDRTGVEIRGLELTSTAGNAVHATSANAANLGVRISENTIVGLGTYGIIITQGSSGTATLDVHANTVVATIAGISIARTGGTAVITAFSDNVVSGDSGAGIEVAGGVTFDATPGGALDPVSGGVTIIGAPGNGVGGAGLALSNVTGALDFVDLDVFAGSNAALIVTGTGAFTGATGTQLTVAAGVATLVANAGPAVALADLTANLQVGGLTSANSSGSGVALVNVAGTFTAPPGSTITNATGPAFVIGGGNATVTYAGTIADDQGVLVSISGATGGAKTFSGAITDGGAGGGGGITLSGNSASTTVTFSGGLTLSTGANAAFTANGGGTLHVCDENPCNPAATGALVNTLTTTTATALNVTGTTIGASNLEFRSISSNGGSAAGIVLSSTGTTGGLKIKGTGSAGSGGTIANKTGSDGDMLTGIGISLNNTANVSIDRMQLNDFQNNAIRGLSVTAFRLTNTVVSGANGNNSAGSDGAISFGTSNPGGANGLLGTGASASLIDNVDVSGAIEHTIEVYNQSGSFGLTISNSNIHDNSVGSGSDGILVETQGTSTATIRIAGNSFSNLKSQGIQLNALDNSAVDLTISGNTVTRGTQGNEGIVLANAANARLTTLVENNTISGFGGVGIFAGQGPGNATSSSLLHATIRGNTVTSPASATNHSIIAFLTSTVGQVSQARLLIDDNTVTQASTTGVARGILVDTPDANTTPAFHATVTNNDVAILDNVGGVGGIVVQSRRDVGRFAVSGNVVTYPNGTPGGILGIRVRQAAPGSVDLERGVSASNDAAVVLAENHPSPHMSGTEILGTVTVINNGIVELPSTPPLPLSAGLTGVEADMPSPVVPLAAAPLEALVRAARTRLAAARLTPGQYTRLQEIRVTLAKVGDGHLSEYADGRIAIDPGAAGRGWFVDPTPLDDEEFPTVSGSERRTHPAGAPAGRYDLLTALMHEMHHVLGRADVAVESCADEVMTATLPLGVRRTVLQTR